MDYREGDGEAVFTIRPPKGDLQLLPRERQITVEMTGFLPEAAGEVKVSLDGKVLDKETASRSYDERKQAVIVCAGTVRTGQGLQIVLPLKLRARKNAVDERIFAFLDQAEISFVQKDEIYQLVKKERRIPLLLGQLGAMDLGKDLYGALAELLTGAMPYEDPRFLTGQEEHKISPAAGYKYGE